MKFTYEGSELQSIDGAPYLLARYMDEDGVIWHVIDSANGAMLKNTETGGTLKPDENDFAVGLYGFHIQRTGLKMMKGMDEWNNQMRNAKSIHMIHLGEAHIPANHDPANIEMPDADEQPSELEKEMNQWARNLKPISDWRSAVEPFDLVHKNMGETRTLLHDLKDKLLENLPKDKEAFEKSLKLYASYQASLAGTYAASSNMFYAKWLMASAVATELERQLAEANKKIEAQRKTIESLLEVGRRK